MNEEIVDGQRKRKLIFDKQNLRQYSSDFLVLLSLSFGSIICSFISKNQFISTMLVILGTYYGISLFKKVRQHVIYYKYYKVTKSEFREDRLKKILKK